MSNIYWNMFVLFCCCFADLYRPTTVESLTELEDIAEEKAAKYGESFLDCIKEFCSERDWLTDKKSSVSLPEDAASSQVSFACIPVSQCD